MVTMNRITDALSEMDTSQTTRLDYVAPLSGRLPALERNILKYRALEMMLVLFYCDHLKRKIRTVTDRNVQFGNRLKENKKKTGRQIGAGMSGKESMRVLREMELINEAEAAGNSQTRRFSKCHRAPSAKGGVGCRWRRICT